jgi:hypothetical protein
MVLKKSSYKKIKDQSNKRKLQQSYPNKAHNPLQASAIDDNNSLGDTRTGSKLL